MKIKILLVLALLLSPDAFSSDVDEGLVTLYGKYKDYPVYALFLTEVGTLSIRIFNVKKEEYEDIAKFYESEAKKLSVYGSKVPFGKSYYKFFWVEGKLNWKIEEVLSADGLRNVYMTTEPGVGITLNGRDIEARGPKPEVVKKER